MVQHHPTEHYNACARAFALIDVDMNVLPQVRRRKRSVYGNLRAVEYNQNRSEARTFALIEIHVDILPGVRLRRHSERGVQRRARHFVASMAVARCSGIEIHLDFAEHTQ